MPSNTHGLPDQNGLNLVISIQQPVQSPEPDIPCAYLFSRCCIVRESCRHYLFVLWTLLFVADPLRSGYWRSLARTVSTGTAIATQTNWSTYSFALPLRALPLTLFPWTDEAIRPLLIRATGCGLEWSFPVRDWKRPGFRRPPVVRVLPCWPIPGPTAPGGRQS